jgi:precorrin-6Y C5,15-methyltransferase (decarboxylating)
MTVKESAGIVTVVGIGADGWDGLPEAARREIRSAEVLIGSPRQLALIPAPAGDLVAWPSPLIPALPALLATHAGRSICVLASGDPMFFGVGATLTRLLGADRVRVLPQPSSVSLACARLGWPAGDVEVISVVGRPIELLHPAIQPGRRLLVLSADGSTPALVAGLLAERGYGPSELTVLEQLGGPAERRLAGTADGWQHPAGDPLNVLAVVCRATPGAPLLPTVPGLPDDAYDHDGQLTKREVRAVTLASLAPVPGQLLWDVGAGAGSIAIEWARAHRSCRAVAIESHDERADRIAANAARLGVPGVQVVRGRAPEALAGLDRPDAVFVGGGATVDGVLDAGWDALLPGGRFVVNAVTVESEAVVARWYGRLGGELTRIAVQRAAPVGGFTGWRPAMPVTVWSVVKP